jgi:hypothetical protein
MGRFFIDKNGLKRYTFCNSRHHRLMVRTGGSHPPNRGSIPRGATKQDIPKWDVLF